MFPVQFCHRSKSSLYRKGRKKCHTKKTDTDRIYSYVHNMSNVSNVSIDRKPSLCGRVDRGFGVLTLSIDIMWTHLKNEQVGSSLIFKR